MPLDLNLKANISLYSTNVNSPVYLRTPVKIYEDASQVKSEVFLKTTKKNVALIYLWFNKVTGKVYVGSSVNGSKRLISYYQPSVLKRKIIIYQSILKQTWKFFSFYFRNL